MKQGELAVITRIVVIESVDETPDGPIVRFRDEYEDGRITGIRAIEDPAAKLFKPQYEQGRFYPDGANCLRPYRTPTYKPVPGTEHFGEISRSWFATDSGDGEIIRAEPTREQADSPEPWFLTEDTVWGPE